MPVRVTLLCPFLAAAEVGDGVLAELAWFCRGANAFAVRFTGPSCGPE